MEKDITWNKVITSTKDPFSLEVAEEFVKFVSDLGAIPAYAYLGDVGDSVTGDKKAQKFEDDFLPELIKEIKNILK